MPISRTHVPTFPILAMTLVASTQGVAYGSEVSSPVLGLRPGLWEVQLTYQSVDGRQVLNDRDLLARLLASVDPATLALDRADTGLSQSPCANEGAGEANTGGSLSQADKANFSHSQDMPNCTLPFAMRMQAEAALNESGANSGASSSFRICLTPAVAALDAPVLDERENCRPEQVRTDRKHETFTFSCGSNGTALNGKGQSRHTLLGHVLTVTDFTATTSSHTHYSVHNRTEMKFIGASCGALQAPAR